MSSLICVLPSPDIDFSMSTNQISYGSSEVVFVNSSTNALDYFWDFGDGNTDTLYNPSAYEYEVNDESFFIVTLNGITDLGCADSLQLELIVNQDAIIFAPNTFTPDGDGLNDSWFPSVSSGIDQDFFGVQIYNRWGELIFEASDFYSSWDGTFQGNKVPIGTYTYRINYKKKQTEQREVIVGHVSLIR
jgi:gliding motility-associated-like protein